MHRRFPPTALLVPFALAATQISQADTLTLDTLTDSILVGQSDAAGGTTAPLAVGDGWFSAVYSGTLRQRATTQFELRTQWYFRFDVSGIAGISAADITGATLRLPQIGRLNGNAGNNVPLRVFDPNATWDTGGSNYPKWNLGRESPNNTGGSGGTELANFPDAYDTFGTGPVDTNNPDVEGVFTTSSAALLTAVQSWAAGGASNEGLLASMTGADNIGLAFGEPTLEIELADGALTDTDDDGMPDSYETANGTDIGVKDAGLDKDEDGLTNIQEYLGQDASGATTGFGQTLSGMADTDGDGVDDGDELSGVLNPWSNRVLGTPPGDRTDPTNANSDNEGGDDGDEIAAGTDPNAPPPNTGPLFPFVDTDGDSYSDAAEDAFGSAADDSESCPDHTPPPAKPNVVIIYADDMGFGDMSVYSALYGTANPVSTPNMDALAAAGVMFTQAHSSNGVCTPSRYALLTGKYNWREFNGITNHFGGQMGGDEVPRPSDVTIAEFLKGQSYDTAAFGKWHLGGAFYTRAGARVSGNPNTPDDIDWARPIEHHAVANGFDTFRGLAATINRGPYVYLHDDRVQYWDASLNGDTGDYRDATNADTFHWFTNTELNSTVVGAKGSSASLGDPSYTQVRAGPQMIEQVEGYLASRAASMDSNPFFAYVALYSPHYPQAITPPFVGSAGFHSGDFIKEVDDRIGRVVAAIDNNGFGANTIVVLTSDNGPENGAVSESLSNGGDPNGPLRGNKRDVWDGGTRVPFVVRWPGQAAPGLVSNELVWQGDIFATVAAFLGEDLPAGVAPDGESFLNLIRGQQKPSPRRPSLVVSSIRGDLGLKTTDGWKFIDSSGGGHSTSWDSSNASIPGAAGTNRGTPKQLFRQAVDLGEDNNLIAGVGNDAAIRTELLSLYGGDLLGELDLYRTQTTAERFPRAPDSDADGMSDSFERAEGFDPDSPKDALADRDGDGSPNGAEAIAGTDLDDPTDYLHIASIANDAAEVTVRWPVEAGRTYQVLWSDDMGEWHSYSSHPAEGVELEAMLDKAAIDAENGVLGDLARLFVRIAVSRD